MKKIGLGLSGGAVRGLAHIGVIRELEDANIPVSFIAGTSAGSLVGALVAAGYRYHDLYQIARSLTWKDLGKLTFPSKGFLSGEALEEFVHRHIGNITIEELPIPFAAIATNLNTGATKAFTSGPLAPAIRASCAIPGVYTPMEREGAVYVDGGVKSFDPVRHVRELGAEFTISVKLTPSPFPSRPPGNIVEVLLAAFDINTSHIAGLEPEGDVTIEPDLSGTNPYDFDQIEDLVDRGRRAASAMIRDIRDGAGISGPLARLMHHLGQDSSGKPGSSPSLSSSE